MRLRPRIRPLLLTLVALLSAWGISEGEALALSLSVAGLILVGSLSGAALHLTLSSPQPARGAGRNRTGGNRPRNQGPTVPGHRLRSLVG